MPENKTPTHPIAPPPPVIGPTPPAGPPMAIPDHVLGGGTGILPVQGPPLGNVRVAVPVPSGPPVPPITMRGAHRK